MEYRDLEQLIKVQNVVVFTTFRSDGRPQMSLVTVGSFEGGLVFTTQENRAKAANLRRDPRCAIMVVKPGYRGYAVLDGEAEVRSKRNTGPDKLRLDLRDVYRAVGGKEHPDWEEYDQAMVQQRRLIVLLRPGSLLGINVP
jgi:PPOX class probable F420-dependent enzyme